jgi:hypothetical protein
MLIAVLAAGAAGTAGWFWRMEIGAWFYHRSQAVAGMPDRPVPDVATYAVLMAEMDRWREDFSMRHAKARTAGEREIVESDARLFLEETLPAMMRCWLGTPWDFHGTAEGPGKGKIACGYFVATVLRDAGFRVDRYKLAQQASENIMRSFIGKDACSLTVGQSYDAFADRLAESAPGVYIVGLDTHVAFVVVEKSGFRFIHSSGSAPWCVVDEGRDEAEVLKKSKWRMLGNFTGDPGVVRSWLKGGRIQVKGA